MIEVYTLTPAGWSAGELTQSGCKTLSKLPCARASLRTCVQS